MSLLYQNESSKTITCKEIHTTNGCVIIKKLITVDFLFKESQYKSPQNTDNKNHTALPKLEILTPE